jgi:hypothetical protein
LDGDGGKNMSGSGGMSTTQTYRNNLRYELENLTQKCKDFLNKHGFGMDRLLNGVDTINFYSAISDANLTMHSIVPQVSTLQSLGAWTKEQLLKQPNATGITVTIIDKNGIETYSNVVVLTPVFHQEIPLPFADPWLVLVHEEMHVLSRKGDQALARDLFDVTSGNFSDAVSNGLAKECAP